MNLSFSQTYNFEENCSENALAFQLGCIPDWEAVYGTPSIRDNGGAFEGQKFAFCYTQLRVAEPKYRGESILLNYSFEAGKTYKIKYARRSRIVFWNSNTGLEIKWILTNGLTSTSPNDGVQPIPSQHQTIATITGSHTNQWVIDEYCFTPNQNYNQLWMRNIMTHNSPDVVDSRDGEIYIDNFSITKVTPDFFFSDEFGNPKSSFCYGEDVFIKINNPYLNQAHLDAWLSPNCLTEWYTGPGWVNIQNGMVNISNELRISGQRPFEPSNSYCVKLAIGDPSCGWIETIKSFEYKCCENIDYANFNTHVIGSSAPFTIHSASTNDYSIYGGHHEFCIYSDFDQNGEYELITCQNGTSFNYNALDAGINYYIVHRVSTPCGDYCNLVTVSVGSFTSYSNVSSSNIDCNQFPKTCPTPNISCPQMVLLPNGQGQSLALVYNTVSPVSSFDIQIVENDTYCGCSRNLTKTHNISTNNRYFDLSDPKYKKNCFSYRVRSKCADGSVSLWSPKMCYPNCAFQVFRHRNIDEFVGYSNVKISPNPVENFVNYELIIDNGDALKNISIMDLTGRKLQVIDINSDSDKAGIDVSTLFKGIYFARFEFLKTPHKTIKFVKVD